MSVEIAVLVVHFWRERFDDHQRLLKGERFEVLGVRLVRRACSTWIRSDGESRWIKIKNPNYSQKDRPSHCARGLCPATDALGNSLHDTTKVRSFSEVADGYYFVKPSNPR